MEDEVFKLRRDIGRCRYVLRNVSDPPARAVLEDMIAEAETQLTLLYDRQVEPAATASRSIASWQPTNLAKAALVAVILATVGSAAQAQTVYQPYQPYPYYQPRPPTPPSWSYDPYTSGLGPCPQGTPGDLEKCRDRMPPTYGQPSFWPR